MSASYASAPYPVTGVAIPGGTQSPPEIPMRLDIVDLATSATYAHQFSLFVRAWTEIAKPGFKPKAASFQEIAGIHGLPYIPWLGDPDETRTTNRGPWLGYCNHASILFPTWHRPYLMVLEQILSDVAHGIASSLAHPTTRGTWMSAAEKLRLPFWDWTHPRTGESGLPSILTDKTVEILTSNGDKEEVKNPLAHYTLLDPPIDGFDNRQQLNRIHNQSTRIRAYFREWKRTYRHPTAQAVNATDNYAKINEILKSTDASKEGTWRNLTTSVAGMFNFPHDIAANEYAKAWDNFSNTTIQSGRKWGAVPIEQPHNTVHVVVGGIGHMNDSDTAAYDPIFFLHHCNVDRLLAFWEHIYPNYVAGTNGYTGNDGNRKDFTQAGGTWTETQNKPITDQSGLVPFRNAGYTHWTSQGTHSLLHYDPRSSATKALSNKYYTYPPIVHGTGQNKVTITIDTNPSQLTSPENRKIQRAALQQYFGHNFSTAMKDSGITLLPRMFEKEAPYSGQVPHGYKRIPNYREFIIRVSLDPAFIKGSHTLTISVDPSSLSGPNIPLPTDQTGSPRQPYEVGRVDVFSRGSSERCGNCQAQQAAGVRVHGVVPVPHWVITGIIVAQQLNRKDATDDDLIQKISLSLGAALSMPDGTLHSELRGDDGTKAGEALSGDGLPQLELWSSDVYQEIDEGLDEEHAPYEFGDWKNHTTPAMFEGVGRHWYSVEEQ